MKTHKIYNSGSTRKNNTRKKRGGFYNKNPQLLKLNGFNLLLLPLKGCKTTKVECSIFGGCNFECDNTSGISHLLEHIFMGSSEICGKEKCDIFLNKYGIVSNAHAREMNTHYWLKGLPRHTDIMLNFITSMIFDPRITEKLLNEEKEAVKNELKGFINNPQYSIDEVLYKNIYKDRGLILCSDYKKQISLLKNIDIKQINNHLNKIRNNNGILFTLSGKIDTKSVIKYFKRFKISGKNTFNWEKIRDLSDCFSLKKKVLYVNDHTSSNTRISIAYPVNIKVGDKDSLILGFLNNVLSNGLGSILLKRLRGDLKLIYKLSIDITTNLCGTIVRIDTETLNRNAETVIKEIFRLIGLYMHEKLPQINIESQKKKYKLHFNSICRGNSEAVSDFYKWQYFWQMNKGNKNIYRLKDVGKTIDEIDHKMLTDMMRKVFDTSRCILVYGGKQKLSITTSVFNN